MKTIGILGYGEVGKAIAKFYSSPMIKDIDRDDGLNGVDVLHVCIPYSDRFVDIVKREMEELKPKLTIIHSTVAPGTTKEIGGMVVHNPIRGKHPNLYQGIKTFVSYIGTDNKEACNLAEKHLKELGITTRAFYPSTTTELGKLFSTCYYGLCIAWHGEMKKICDKEGIDFEKAVTDFNETYNEGYIELESKNVVRPVLYPPNKGITGHCITSNTEILKEYHKSDALDLILKYGR